MYWRFIRLKSVTGLGSIMKVQKQASNPLLTQTNQCCTGFLQNQIGVLQAIRNTLEEYTKEEVINHIDQILNYYKQKLEELPKKSTT